MIKKLVFFIILSSLFLFFAPPTLAVDCSATTNTGTRDFQSGTCGSQCGVCSNSFQDQCFEAGCTGCNVSGPTCTNQSQSCGNNQIYTFCRSHGVNCPVTTNWTCPAGNTCGRTPNTCNPPVCGCGGGVSNCCNRACTSNGQSCQCYGVCSSGGSCSTGGIVPGTCTGGPTGPNPGTPVPSTPTPTPGGPSGGCTPGSGSTNASCGGVATGPMCNGNNCATQGYYCSAGNCVLGWAGGGSSSGCNPSCGSGTCTPGNGSTNASCGGVATGPMWNGPNCATQGYYCSAGNCVLGWAGGGPATGCTTTSCSRCNASTNACESYTTTGSCNTTCNACSSPPQC